MSKLLLQLKQAQALREQARAAVIPAAVPAVIPAEATQPVIPAEAGTQPSAEAGSPPTRGRQPAEPTPARPARLPLMAASLAAVIFLGVVFAWRATPWKMPAKVRIDPAALKLDSHLDITRLRQTTPR